jgi:hypothetical protein
MGWIILNVYREPCGIVAMVWLDAEMFHNAIIYRQK